MDAPLHLRVLWRFRGVMAGGLLVGVLLAVLMAYRVSWVNGPALTPRGAEQWTSTSQLLLTQPGFPWGRAVLPGAGAIPAAPPQNATKAAKAALSFADPGRFSTLAGLYAVIALSDQARTRLPQATKPDQIRAVPLAPAAAASTVLPVLSIDTIAGTPEAARRLNVDLLAALRAVLREQQDAARVPLDQRVNLETLNFPGRATLTAGRSVVKSILAFVLALVCAIAWCHILFNLRGLGHPVAVDLEPPRDARLRDLLIDGERLRLSDRTAAPPHG